MVDPRDSALPSPSRRQMMRMIGASAVLGVAGKLGGIGDLAEAAAQPGGLMGNVRFPAGAIIRTIQGDIDPTTITGATLMHEHLGSGTTDKPPATAPGQDRNWMAVELKAARTEGLGCIVSAGAPFTGANTDYFKFLAEQTGLKIIAAGGYNTSYPPDVPGMSDDQIADRFVEAARVANFGAYGEFGVGIDHPDLDETERKVFRALGKAHVRTGLPIFTHNNYSTGPHVPADIALRQLDILESVGADPRGHHGQDSDCHRQARRVCRLRPRHAPAAMGER
jgi:phosphotriesterase-related protein